MSLSAPAVASLHMGSSATAASPAGWAALAACLVYGCTTLRYSLGARAWKSAEKMDLTRVSGAGDGADVLRVVPADLERLGLHLRQAGRRQVASDTPTLLLRLDNGLDNRPPPLCPAPITSARPLRAQESTMRICARWAHAVQLSFSKPPMASVGALKRSPLHYDSRYPSPV